MTGNFIAISIDDAYQRWLRRETVFVDIRDPQSFQNHHVPGAFHLTQETLEDLLHEVDKKMAIIVICYHGHSSRNVAQYLNHLGYSEVYSVDGGFVEWSKQYPENVESDFN